MELNKGMVDFRIKGVGVELLHKGAVGLLDSRVEGVATVYRKTFALALFTQRSDGMREYGQLGHVEHA